MTYKQDGLYIIVTEYPKSGGSWLTSMIGDSLGISKRDIYVTDDVLKNPDNKYYKNIRKIDWYAGFESVNAIPPCVVKSHELPGSPLVRPDAKMIHLLRDGRDVAVSRYFFNKVFCVNNGLIEKFDIPFEQYITTIAHEWNQYMRAWLQHDIPTIKYEDLLTNTNHALMNLLDQLGLEYSVNQVHDAIVANEKKQFRARLAPVYADNSFVRKCIIGDWKNHFTKNQERIFYDIAGDMLDKLNYTKKKKLRAVVKKIRETLSPAKRSMMKLVGRLK